MSINIGKPICACSEKRGVSSGAEADWARPWRQLKEHCKTRPHRRIIVDTISEAKCRISARTVILNCFCRYEILQWNQPTHCSSCECIISILKPVLFFWYSSLGMALFIVPLNMASLMSCKRSLRTEQIWIPWGWVLIIDFLWSQLRWTRSTTALFLRCSNWSISVKHNLVATLTFVINATANRDCLLLCNLLQPNGDRRTLTEERSGY